MLVYFVLVPVIIGIFLNIFPFGKAGRIVAIAAQSALFCFAAYIFFLCKDGEITERIGSFEGMLGITLYADNLSSFFVLLTVFIFLVATIYTFNDADTRLFKFLLFLWEGLLIGLLLSRDLFNIFVLLEVVTLTVSVLIMFRRDNRSMYDGIFFLMINTVAVQFLLFGVGYLYKLTGTFDIDALGAALAGMDKSSLVLPYVLIMTCICLKCGLVPLYSWLPRAHGTPGAPPSVSAILSGVHVKSSIYLFIRFRDIFSEMFIPEVFLVIGIITGILGFVLALSQTDIKMILAYHTISQIGLIIIGLSAGNETSFTGGLFHVFNHAMFKGALFLCAGIITRMYATRNIYQIRGVLKRAPVIGVIIIMAALGITGAPFFNGSISKYFITSGAELLTNGAVIVINLGTIISFIKFTSILGGRAEPEVQRPAAGVKPDGYSVAAALILGVMCLFGGIFGESSVRLLFDIDLSVDAAGYLQKCAIFAGSLAAGYFIYKYIISGNRFLKRLQNADIGFRTICVLLGCFFAALLMVTQFFG